VLLTGSEHAPLQDLGDLADRFIDVEQLCIPQRHDGAVLPLRLDRGNVFRIDVGLDVSGQLDAYELQPSSDCRIA